jgi:hypothetical protein
MAGQVTGFWTQNGERLIAEAEARLVNGRMPRGGWVEIGEKLGLTAYVCAHQYKALQQRAAAPPRPVEVKPEKAAVDPIEEAAGRADRVRELRRERELLTAVAGERSFRSYLEGLVRETSQRFEAPPPYRKSKPAAGTTDETMLLMLSDLHAAEEVSAEGTRGINEYNARITSQRLRRVVEGHLSIKRKMERGGWRFRKLVIGANGDFVPGTIHEIERHTDAKNIVHTVYGTGMLLAQAIRDLAAEYEEVDIFGTSGNHGRFPDAKRVQQKDPTRNWDTMVYLYAREHLRLDERIRWHIPAAYSVVFNIEGWNFIQTHGHDVKSWMSIPYYGLDRMVRNINALEASRGSIIHYWLVGHFHSASSIPINAGEVFVNGSLVGASEYTVNALGKADQPRQYMLGVHREHGVTHRWPVIATCEPEAPEYGVNWL